MVVRAEGGRRCDHLCYDAKHLSCACICGGRNHGMGLVQALRNEGMTMDEAESIMEARAVNESDEDVIAQESVAANEEDDEPDEDYDEDLGDEDEDEDDDFESCPECGAVQEFGSDVCSTCGALMSGELPEEDEGGY